MVSGTVVLGLSVPLRLERPREARIKFGPTMRRFPIWGLIWRGESACEQSTLGLKGSVDFISAGIVLVRREHLEVTMLSARHMERL